MRFYKLDLIRWDKYGHVYPKADSTFTCEALAEEYFAEKIRNYNCVDDAPLFDYFNLKSITTHEEDDWILNDAHTFAGPVSPVVRGWLVSEFFKLLLEGFSIAPPYRFYDAKVMYQDAKYDYYIFQLAHKHWDNIDYEQSDYLFWSRYGLNEPVPKGLVHHYDEMYPIAKTKRDAIHKFVDMKVSNAFLKNYYDIIPEYNSANGILISERVKVAIEQAQITGVFTELYTQTEFLFADRA